MICFPKIVFEIQIQGINATWNKGSIINLNAGLPIQKVSYVTSHKSVIINFLQSEYLKFQNLTCLLSALHQFPKNP